MIRKKFKKLAELVAKAINVVIDAALAAVIIPTLILLLLVDKVRFEATKLWHKVFSEKLSVPVPTTLMPKQNPLLVDEDFGPGILYPKKKVVSKKPRKKPSKTSDTIVPPAPSVSKVSIEQSTKAVKKKPGRPRKKVAKK